MRAEANRNSNISLLKSLSIPIKQCLESMITIASRNTLLTFSAEMLRSLKIEIEDIAPKINKEIKARQPLKIFRREIEPLCLNDNWALKLGKSLHSVE